MSRNFSFGDEALLSKAIYSQYSFGKSNGSDLKRMRTILLKAIASELTFPQRYCLTEYYLSERKMKDIAKELGVNPSTVTRHISKAKEKLRRIAAYY